MKMLFSINTQKPILIPRNIPKEDKEKPEVKKELFNRNSYPIQNGLFSIIKNYSNCSSCGK